MANYAPFLCLGVCRFCGCIGFFGCVWPVFRAAERHWHLTLDSADDVFKAGPAGAAAIALALIAGLVGMAAGETFGMRIRVAENSAALRINVLWHCVANGSILWVANTIALAGVALHDKQAIRAFANADGRNLAFSAAALGAAGAAMLGLAIGRILVQSPRREGSGERLMLVLPFAVGVPLGLLTARLWDFPLAGGALIGFLFPLLVTTMAGGMWERDQAVRMRPEASIS